MKEVAVYEAKPRLSELLVEVEQGEQITITRRGLPVARWVGVIAAKRAANNQRQQVTTPIASLRSNARAWCSKAMCGTSSAPAAGTPAR